MSAQETILTKRFSEKVFFDFDYCCRKGSFPAFWSSHNSDFSYSLNHLAYFIAFQLISNSRRFTEGPRLTIAYWKPDLNGNSRSIKRLTGTHKPLNCTYPILASFDVLVSHLPKIEEDKGKIGCPTLPEEKATKITFIPLQSRQILVKHRPKFFLPQKRQFQEERIHGKPYSVVQIFVICNLNISLQVIRIHNDDHLYYWCFDEKHTIIIQDSFSFVNLFRLVSSLRFTFIIPYDFYYYFHSHEADTNSQTQSIREVQGFSSKNKR